MGPGRPLRRRLFLTWTGVVMLWGVSLLAAYVLAPDRLALVGGLAAAAGVAIGVVATRRAIRASRRPLITVRDLRAGLRQRPR